MLARLRDLHGSDTPLRCAVAWSGGLDSTVLVHLLRAAARLPRARLTLRALHVDHGLQPAAVDFRRFCVRTARTWRLPLRVLTVDARAARGESVEQVARLARRAALVGALAPGEYLLTAQHADDQLETVLLALLRGAGPEGLAAMPARLPLEQGALLRPLLEWSREQLAAHASAHQLGWMEDPTNEQQRFDRNYLRGSVLPVLRSRWPAVARTAARSARHCGVTAEALARLADADLELAADGADLQIPVLRRWSTTRRAAVLRAWIDRAGARAPNERHLVQIEAMLAARPDAHPELRLADLLVQRRGARLCLTVRGRSQSR